jgi:hypothetical protein
MTKFQAFGMAGVGIAVAIGFVFALSTLANYANDDDAGLDSLQRQDRELSSTQPSSSLFVQQQQQQQQNASDGIASDVYGGSEDSAATGMNSIENETAFGGEDASLMMQQPEEAPPSQSLQPTLVAILATDAITGEVIGEAVPGTEFETGKPVFIRAHLMNLDGIQISDSIIALGISNNDGDNNNGEEEGEVEENTTIDRGLRNGNSSSAMTQHLLYEQAASFRGNIGAGENIELELYWNPVQSGEYTLLLFSVTLDELTSAATDEEQIVPVASIPIKVAEAER